jgi:small subunit ribosomal protein S6
MRAATHRKEQDLRDYELMLVLDPNLDEAGIEGVTNRIATLVTQRGGTVLDSQVWGRRRLAYPIRRFRDGVYILSHLHLAPDATEELERNFRLTEAILRHLLIRAPASTPAAAAAA